MEDFSFAFILPYANGDLFEYFNINQDLSEKCILAIIQNLLSALRYIHGIGIMHRNIKLENILLIDDTLEHFNVVLADFCDATSFLPDEKFNDFKIGSLQYNAPEIYNQQECFIIK